MRFDFSQPITVTAHGRVVAEKRLEPSVATPMKWAPPSNDRAMPSTPKCWPR